MNKISFGKSLGMLLLLASVWSSAQQKVPLGSRLKLHWHGSSVRFIEDGRTHEVSIKGLFDAVELESVKLQSATESNGFMYLLLDVVGPSKLPRDSHECGAGSESNLVWLKLDREWKLLDSKNFRYDSCWASISAIDPPLWEGDTLTVTTENKVVTYSYKRPEEGLKITDSAPAK
jgi:hypothetical protein